MGNLEIPKIQGIPIMPNNYCLGEVECALGVKLLDRIDEINSQKRHLALSVIDKLSGCSELIFHREESPRHNYHLLVAQLANNLRNPFIRQMANRYGIQCVVQYYPLNRYPFYEKLGFGKANCPNTDLFFDNMVSFPFHHMMSDELFAEMITITKKVITDL